jgi:hypothetical protein
MIFQLVQTTYPDYIGREAAWPRLGLNFLPDGSLDGGYPLLCSNRINKSSWIRWAL